MNDFEMSKHAQSRIQQRGIPPLVVEWLIEYGANEYDRHGAQIYYFDKRSRRNIAQSVGKQVVDRLGDLFNAYLVISVDGVVITAGHRYKRVTHH